MNQHHDLESAIDLVSKQLTSVGDDPAFTARIVASLPERTTWYGWLVTSWTPRLAMLAMVAAGAMLAIDRQSQSTTAVLPSAPATVIASAFRPNLAPVAPNRTKPLEPLEPLEPSEPQADHEFSLLALDVEALTPMDLPAETSIELAPLAILDLPLSGEFPERN